MIGDNSDYRGRLPKGSIPHTYKMFVLLNPFYVISHY